MKGTNELPPRGGAWAVLRDGRNDGSPFQRGPAVTTPGPSRCSRWHRAPIRWTGSGKSSSSSHYERPLLSLQQQQMMLIGGRNRFLPSLVTLYLLLCTTGKSIKGKKTSTAYLSADEQFSELSFYDVTNTSYKFRITRQLDNPSLWNSSKMTSDRERPVPEIRKRSSKTAFSVS